MPEELINKAGAIFFLFFGSFWVVFHKAMAKWAIENWKKRMKIKAPSERSYQISFLLVGVFFIVISVLELLGLFK